MNRRLINKLSAAANAYQAPFGSWYVEEKQDAVLLVWDSTGHPDDMYGDEPWTEWGGNHLLAEIEKYSSYFRSGIDCNGDQWVEIPKD